MVIALAQARLLGPVTASYGEREIDLGPPRQRALFAALAAHANRVVSREELVDAVWGVDAPATAMNSVYTYVARLRSRLEPTRRQRARSDLLVSDGSGYMLLLPPDHVDKQRFERCLENARQLRAADTPEAAIAELEAALKLWHGTPYGGAVGPFVEAERSRLNELRLVAMEDRAELLLDLQRQSDVVGELYGLVCRHRLRERLRYLLMRCYVQLGRQAEALTEYHDLRIRLAEELGVEPGDRLQRYYEHILRRGQPPARSLIKVRPVAAAPSAAPSGTALAQLVRDVPGFTGRTSELRQLHDLVEAARTTGESPVILLSGMPGIGKTALAVHFAHSLSTHFPDGQLQVNLRGVSESGGPMTPGEALGHLLAALGAPPPAAASTDVERQCALYRSLVSDRRLLILLDNAASVEQVRPLLPGASSCVVVVTSRNRLAGLAVREGARRITLDVLSDRDAVRLFNRVVDTTVDIWAEPATSRVVAACGGLPLALRIAAARINAAPSPAGAVAHFAERNPLNQLTVPGDEHSSVRTIFEWSYRTLPSQVAHMFRALGRHREPNISLATAAGLTGECPHRVRQMLDVLVDASLVQEPVYDRFAMHPLVFAYARELSAATDNRVA